MNEPKIVWICTRTTGVIASEFCVKASADAWIYFDLTEKENQASQNILGVE